MKILIISQYFYPESFRVNLLAKELVRRNHDVTVLTGYPQYPYGEIYDGYGYDIPYEKEWNGVKIHRLKVKPRGHNAFGLLSNCVTFVTQGNKWVKSCDEKFDLIYVFEVSPVTVGLPAVKFRNKYKCPMLFNVQDLWPENVIEVLGIDNKLIIGVINRIVDKIYNNSDKILCSSKGFVKNIEARGVQSDKLIFWPQFCETPDYNGLKKPACYNSRYFNIVFTGNIGYAQGLDLLLNTAELMKDEAVRFYIVGDGRAKDDLLKRVAEKELSDKVFFVGRVSEREADCYVKHADCAYLSFSNSKLFDLTIPAKLQTYLACGAMVLGAVGGESVDIINNARCGLVAKKNPDDVAEKIRMFMNMSDDDIERIKNNSLFYFDSQFRMDKVIDHLERIFDEVVL